MIADKPLDVCWDTDIGRDPDDFLAGCFLLSRSELRLRCLTISPGDTDQAALARFLLRETGNADVPIGVVPDREPGKASVGGCHLRLLRHYGAPMRAAADGAGWEVIQDAANRFPGATLLTTGPLNNLGEWLRHSDGGLKLSITMGGYWACPNQPARMPEFNFNGCTWAVRELLKTTRVTRRLLVGKNVTHQVLYDDEMHAQLRLAGEKSRALGLAHELMNLRTGPKKLHDPVAAAAVIREDIFEWEEVAPIKHRGEWGCVTQPASKIWITTDVNKDAFRRLFTGLC